MGLFDFLKKTPASTVAPPDRYAGKPFLKLVDAFVLDCIGELDVSQAALLIQATPMFQKTYSRPGTWQEIVMSELQFESNIVAAIQGMWARNQDIAKQNGVTLTPMEFVEMFVENNVTNA